MDERAAFEANIDANPLDAQNHLVYSDWLRDHGHEDEADFRKAMGEWVHESPAVHDPHSYYEYRIRGDGMNRLPSGIRQEDMGATDNGSEHLRSPHLGRRFGAPIGGGLGWTSYRGMEDGLRRAFTAGRANHNAERMSRRVRARRYARRIK